MWGRQVSAVSRQVFGIPQVLQGLLVALLVAALTRRLLAWRRSSRQR